MLLYGPWEVFAVVPPISSVAVSNGVSVPDDPLSTGIHLGGGRVRRANIEDTEPVSDVVPSKRRHPLGAGIGVGDGMLCTPVFGFLP
jgi:hypothetical protein